MIDNIIQSVTEKLSSLPYIEGIVLGGSRARGTHTEDSDIDIGIYYKSESFDITAINQIATELDDENRNKNTVRNGLFCCNVSVRSIFCHNPHNIDNRLIGLCVYLLQLFCLLVAFFFEHCPKVLAI